MNGPAHLCTVCVPCQTSIHPCYVHVHIYLREMYKWAAATIQCFASSCHIPRITRRRYRRNGTSFEHLPCGPNTRIYLKGTVSVGLCFCCMYGHEEGTALHHAHNASNGHGLFSLSRTNDNHCSHEKTPHRVIEKAAYIKTLM
jgi:hypothetical protein